MKRILLAGTNVETSRLGFGCVQLTAHDSRKEAISTLEHAYSLGITHFDIARAYGFGRAEGILSEFLRGKRHAVTVTTKFGIEPPTGLAGNARAINVLKKILGPFPALLRHAKNRGSAMIKTKSFAPEAAVRSLETSLRELGSDYVDIFLLHEADVADASGSPLVEALLREVAKGKIRHIGMGSAFEKLNEANRLPAEYKILQFEDNVVDQNAAKLSSRDRFLITHSVFVPAQMLLKAVNASPQLFREYSLRIGIDLNDPSTGAALLLRWALWSNANGIVLFSSRNPLHITRNVQEAESAAASQLSDETRLLFAEFTNQLVVAEPRGIALRGLETGASS